MYTSAERSANAKKQLRDKYGKWIFMGGRAKWFDAVAGLFRTGKLVDIADDGSSASIKDSTTGQVYPDVPRTSIEAVKARAVLPSSDGSVQAPKVTAIELQGNEGEFRLSIPLDYTTKPLDLKQGRRGGISPEYMASPPPSFCRHA